MDSKLQALINEHMPRRYYGHEARKYAKIIAEEYAALKGLEAQAKCTIPVVGGSLPSDKEIDESAINWVNENCNNINGDLTVETECFEAGAIWMRKMLVGQ